MGNVLPLFFTAVTGLCLVLVFYAVWRSLRVLVGRGTSGDAGNAGATDRQRLLNEKQALLHGLRDLEQERDMGKVSQDDFETMNTRLRARAREVIKQLDAQVAPFRSKAEALVAEVARTQPSTPEPVATQAAPSSTSEAPTPLAASNTPACAKCQTVNEADAVFCKKCGNKLTDAGEAS